MTYRPTIPLPVDELQPSQYSTGSHSLFRHFYLPALLASVYSLLIAFSVFFLPVHFKEDLGYSGLQIGFLFGVYSLTALAAVFPSGLSTDFITPRRVLFAAVAITVVSTIGLGQVRSYPFCVFFFVLFGLAGNSVKVAVESFIFKTHDKSKSGATFGLYQVFRMGGYGVALLAGGYLLDLIDFPATMTVLAICVGLMAIGVRALPDTTVAWTGLSGYANDFLQPRVLLFSGLLFLFASHWGAETTSYGLFVRENLGLSLVQMGWFMSGEFLTFCLTAWLVGRSYDRGGNLGSFLFIGVLLSGLGHMAMVFPWVPSSLVFRMIHGAGDGFVSVVMYVGVSRLFLRERIGGNSGLINLVIMAGVLAGSLVYGPLGEHFGYQLPLFVSGLIMLPLAFLPQLHRQVSQRNQDS